MSDLPETEDPEPLPRHVRDNLLEKSIVILDQELRKAVTEDLIARLLYLENAASQKPIRLFVNSRGGGVADGFAIMDTMDYVSLPVHTHCYGRADAMAALVVAHGAKFHRSAKRDSMFSLSDPWTEHPTANSPAACSEDLDRARRQICESVAADTGQPFLVIEQKMAAYTVLNPAEAQQFNLIDRILDEGPLDLLDH